ncbi:MAG: ABC transporter ATP-binding protein, partial [Mesorhizobium sp.]
LTNRIKMDIVGERRPKAQEQLQHKSAEIVRIRP